MTPDQSAEEPLSRIPRISGMAPVAANPGTQAMINSAVSQRAVLSDEAAEIARRMEQSALLSGAVERNFRAIRQEVDALTTAATRNVAEFIGSIRSGFQEGMDQGARLPSTARPREGLREDMRQAYIAERRAQGATGFEEMPQVPEGTSTGERPGQQAPLSGRGRHAAPRIDPASGQRRHRVPPGVHEGAGRAGGPSAPSTYAEGFQLGSNLTQLREYASARLNERMSARTPLAPYLQDESGTWRFGMGHPNEGQPLGTRAAAAAPSVMERFARSEARRGRIIGAVNAFGQGGGLSGALGMLTKRAGPIGMAIGAATAGINLAESQREQNRFYQQISGGSNLSGFVERGRERLFGLQGLGTMGQGQARELFRGVSQMGLTGDTRERAFDFSRDQFMATGMDIQDSLALIRTSVQGGVTDFEALSQAIDDVSNTARRGGVNVQEAQKAFARTFEVVTQTLTNTSAAPQIAAAMQGNVTAQGRALSGLDFTGMLGMQGMTMQASALGMDPQAFRALAGSGSAAGLRAIGQGQQAMVDITAQTLITPQARAAAQQMASGMELPNGRLTSEQAAQIGRELATSQGLNVDALMASLQARGVEGVTPANVYEIAGKMALGGFNLDRRYDRQADRMENEGFRPGQQNRLGGDRLRKGREDLTAGERTDLLGDLGYQPRMRAMRYGGVTEIPGLGGEAKDALDIYQGRVARTGRRSKAIEELLAKKGGVSEDTRFLVRTRDGQRSVDLSEAVQYYGDQLRTGRPTILSGNQEGRSVGDVTGVTSDKTAKSASQKAKAGTKDFQAPAGSVRIDLSPEARRVFRAVTTGGAFIGEAGSNAQPPAAFPPSSDFESASGG